MSTSCQSIIPAWGTRIKFSLVPEGKQLSPHRRHREPFEACLRRAVDRVLGQYQWKNELGWTQDLISICRDDLCDLLYVGDTIYYDPYDLWFVPFTPKGSGSVSYTHLTLPTKRIV